MNTVRESAMAALKAGVSVVPVALDGSKRPISRWKQYMQRQPSVEEVETWFAPTRQTGMGFVCGTVSGGLEALDFDDSAAWDAFEVLIEDHGLADLWLRLKHGYLERTPAGGYHVLWRTDAIEGSQKLACRMVADKTEVLIETRGEGGVIVAAPSRGRVHPSGLPYEQLLGGVTTIETISADEREVLYSIARMLDERERQRFAPTIGSANGERPGDRFNAETTWENLLLRYGWTVAYVRGDVMYWRRPDKDIGVSATTNWNGNDLLHVFSTSTPLDADRAYDRFGFYTFMEHGGDFSAAAKALSNRTGHEQNSNEDTDHIAASCLPEKAKRARLVLCSLAEVKSKPIDWLWPGWLARGKIHLLGGKAGDGKSTLATWAAALGSVGGYWPDGQQAPRFRTLFMLGEDAIDDTLLPRLNLHGADVREILALQTVLDVEGRERFFNASKHLDQLEEAVEAHRVDVLVIDPLSTAMAGSDRNSEGSVRDTLSGLSKLAERLNFAVLGIVHVGKPTGVERSAEQQILGSSAFVQVARSVWQTASADDGHKALGITKTNLAIVPPTLLWNRPEDGPIAWHGQSEKSINDLMGGGSRPPRATAEDFLRDALQRGARPGKEVLAEARLLGIAERTLARAKSQLGVEATKERRANGQWLWELPDDTVVF